MFDKVFEYAFELNITHQNDVNGQVKSAKKFFLILTEDKEDKENEIQPKRHHVFLVNPICRGRVWSYWKLLWRTKTTPPPCLCSLRKNCVRRSNILLTSEKMRVITMLSQKVKI